MSQQTVRCASRARSNKVSVTRSTGHSHAIIPPSWPTGPLVLFYWGNGNRRESRGQVKLGLGYIGVGDEKGRSLAR